MGFLAATEITLRPRAQFWKMNVFFLEGPGVFSCVDSAPFSVSFFWEDFRSKFFFGHKGMDNLKFIDVFFWKPRRLRD